MLEALITLKPQKAWMTEVTEESGAAVKIVSRRPFGKHGFEDLVRIELRGAAPEAALGVIRGNRFVSKVEVQPAGEGELLAAVWTDECLACRTLASADCFLVSARTLPEGRMEWRLISNRREVLAGLVETLRAYDADPVLERLSQVKAEEILTKRQMEILRIAYQRGYFDYPKRVGVRELARSLGISISTLSEILRKGQRKVTKAYLDQHFGDR
jgi:predicted DNA binding protein